MMRLFRKVHKWVGLLVGLQVLLWLISGLMISLLDPARVSGQYQANPAQTVTESLPSEVLLEPHQLAQAHLEGALGIKLEVNRDRPVYRVQRSNSVVLLDAVDGSVIVTRKGDAEALARRDYTGDGVITSVTRGMAPDMETRNHRGEYWRVNFSDDVNTSLYISAIDGRVLERRNDYWRVHDFFWMLHIMDYRDRQDFNHVLIVGIALIAIWLGVSGLFMLFGSFNRFDFQFLNIFNSTRMTTVTLVHPENGSLRQLKLRQGSNLFRSLASHGVELPSVCGGGGECGKCRVRLESNTLPDANSTETGLVPGPLRERGYRLACQQLVADNLYIYMPRKKQKHPAS